MPSSTSANPSLRRREVDATGADAEAATVALDRLVGEAGGVETAVRFTGETVVAVRDRVDRRGGVEVSIAPPCPGAQLSRRKK